MSRDGGVTFADAGFDAIVAALDLHPYSGTAESGVTCGTDLCAAGTTCCASCADATCSTDSTCPGIGSPISCDGPEDCASDAGQVCCFTPEGADCRAASECSYEVPDLDAGVPDGGVIDTLLSSGVKVCNRTRDCSVAAGEICCASGKLTETDLGLCVPLILCTP